MRICLVPAAVFEKRKVEAERCDRHEARKQRPQQVDESVSRSAENPRQDDPASHCENLLQELARSDDGDVVFSGYGAFSGPAAT